MSAETVLEFFRRIESDEDFRVKFEADEALKTDTPQALVDAAKRLGVEFTVADYQAYIHNFRGNVKYDELVSSDYLRFMRGCDTNSSSTCGCGNPSGANAT